MARPNTNKMSPAANATIRAGVRTGKVRFENTPEGGEYIYDENKFGMKSKKQKAMDTVKKMFGIQ